MHTNPPPHTLDFVSTRTVFLTRNRWLWLLGLPALAAPWVRFYASAGEPGPHDFAFIDFFDMPGLGYEQTAFVRVANSIGTLPIFIPFLLVPWQARALVGTPRHSRPVQRAAAAIALGWTLFWLLFQLWLASRQVQFAVASWEWQTAAAMAGELARACVLFAVTLAGLIVLCWLLLRPDDPPLDVTQCALLTVFLVAVVPELFADALISHEPDSQDRLLPGFACLLWASAIYALTLALHLSADTDEPRALVAG